MIKGIFLLVTLFKGELHPNQKLAYFVLDTLLKNDICILKQIVQGTQKGHWNFSRLSGFKVMDKYSQNIVLINNSRIAWPT